MATAKKSKPETAANRSATRVTMFERHHLKLLNLGLILYLCFGTILFDLLSFDKIAPRGLEESSKEGRAREGHNARNKSSPSLEELRLSSARRMWNITNQLNILYESNWTLLVLDELVEFERQLVKALASVSSQQQEETADLDIPELELEEKAGKRSGEEAKSAREARRSRSIKRSIVHSLTTITTIGSPQVAPQNSPAKVATMLYAAFGIPLLFYTVARTGKRLAHSASNSLLVISHYGFSLPAYYLCCGCSPYLCCRWLSWCCCCCCCSYLFCPGKNKRKCCDTEGAPKLRLMRRRRSPRSRELRALGGAEQTAFAHSEPSIRREIGFVEPQNQREKSVRFGGRPGESSSNQKDFSENGSDYGFDDDDDDEQLHSTFGLLFASLIVFAIYFSLGAYFYARQQNTTLIDASYACYSMLSTSKLPESFGPADSPAELAAPAHLYETLKSETIKTPKQTTNAQQPVEPSLSTEALIWQTIYLICGLHLISMCAHFAKSWAEGRAGRWSKSEDAEPSHRANGHISATYLSGSFGAAGTGAFLESSPARRLDGGELAPSNVQVQSDCAGNYIAQSNVVAPNLSSDHQLVGTSLEISPSQHSEQLNLAELYVLNNNGNQQQASDMSYTSDRSTDRGSLCLHHQAAVQSLPMNGNGVPADAVYCGPQTTIYTHQQAGCSPNQHHHHPSQKRLYLPASSNRQMGLQRDFRLDELDDDDDNEMDRMLKTCINDQSGKMRPSSSLIQLSQQGGSFEPQTCNLQMTSNGFSGHLQATGGQGSKTLSRVPTSRRQVETIMNGVSEHDNGPNAPDTSSNTISSLSSRTVKITLPGRQQLTPNSRIGFVLDDSNR